MKCILSLALGIALITGFAGCSGGDGEKGVNKDKDKPVPPPAAEKKG